MTRAQKRSLALLRWMIVACIALPITLFVYQGFATYNTTKANADLEIARTRDIAREHAAKVLETIERSLSEINEVVRNLSDDELRANEKTLSGRLSAIERALPQMKSAWLIDGNGRTFATSLLFPSPSTNFADRNYFAVHRDVDLGTYIGPVLTPRPPFGGAPFFSMSRRRSTEDGRFSGIIQASILPDYFEQFYRQIGFERGSTILLMLADGRILASLPDYPDDAQIMPGEPLGQEIARAPDAGLVTLHMQIDGVERRIAYQKLESYPVYIVAGLGTDQIFDRWMDDFRGILFIAVPGTILLLAMLSLFLHRTRRLYIESNSRERAEIALRENQRLEALGQLTGGVAHDFNNLLTVIGSSADLLRRRSLPEERRLRYLDAIADTVTRATALTGQLLAYARRQPLRLEVFDASRRIAAMSDVLQTLLGSVAELEIRDPPEPCAVETDASQFETAIINLVANARDAMPDGGRVTIAANVTANLPERFNRPAEPHGFVAVAVSDTGVGIADAQRDRVFEPFFTTKAVGRGTGLGLSQVFGFVKQSHGEIIVESTPGTGTRFTLFLPRVAKTPAAVEEPRQRSEPTSELRVLLVDDNEALLRATGDALRARGLTVSAVGSAEAALKRLAAPDAQMHVVLTDVVMPGMSGLELAREIRSRYPKLPVIITTGYSDVVERDGEGDLLLIRKPYAIGELVARLTDVAHAREAT